MFGKGTDITDMRVGNTRLISRYIYQHAPTYRRAVAEELGLSIPTVTAAITPLLDAGIMREETPQKSSSVGRPRTMLGFVPEAGFSCGADVGPYDTHYVITDLCGQKIRSQSSKLCLGSYEQVLPRLAEELQTFLNESGVPAEKLLGIGVCLPGLIDGRHGRIYNLFHPGWTGTHFPSELSELTGHPVTMENNARSRVIAVDLFDRAVTDDPALFFFVSRGISCQMHIHGEILQGLSAAAGEIGHTVMQRGGPVCPSCGNRGCLESLAGEWAVVRQAQELMYSGSPTLLWELCPNPEKLTVEQVLEAGRLHDGPAAAILAEAMDCLGTALANTINLISPQTVLLDAGMLQDAGNRKRLLNSCEKHMFRELAGSVKFTFLPYDPERGARGAAATVVSRYLNSL